MRFLKKWLFPALTGLVVLSAVLLPPRLSQIRDGRLLGQVHTEALTAENGLNAQPPTLEERMLLMARWQEGDGEVAVAASEVEDQEALAEAAARELSALGDLSALPRELLLVEPEELFGERLVLQDLRSGVGASFLSVSRYQKARIFWLLLDEESGRIVRLELGDPLLQAPPPDPAATGAAFFARLGVEGELLGTGPAEALFQIAETELQYVVTVNEWRLGIRPTNLSGASAVAVDGAATASAG